MTFYNQLSQVFGYSGTIFNRPPGGTLLLRRLQQEVDISPGVLNETQQELLMLYRSKGRAIPPEIQAMLDDMRKRAAESKDEEKDES